MAENRQTTKALQTSSKLMAWSGLQNVFQQLLHLAVLMILSRELSETDFGIVNIIVIFVAISQALADSGFSTAIVQAKEVSRKDLNTVFTFNLVVCVGLFGLIWGFAPQVGRFFDSDFMIWPLRIIALKILTFPFALVAAAVLRRELKLRTITLLSMLGNTVGSVTAIVMAWLGYGVWCPIIQQLILASVMAGGQVYFCSWRPRIEMSKQSFMRLIPFGTRIMGVELLTQSAKNLYGAVIGKAYSLADTGIVGRAQGVMQTPAGMLNATFGDGASYMLYRYQHESADGEMLNAVRSLHRLYCYVCIPGMLLLLVLAEPVVVVILSAKWLAAVPYLQVIALTGLFYPTQYYSQAVMKITGNPGWLLKFETVQQIMIIAALLICAGLKVPIIELLAWQIAVQVLAFAGYAAMMKKLIKYQFKLLIKDLINIYLLAVPMAAAAYGIFFMLKNLPAPAVLLASAAGGAIVYFGMGVLSKSTAQKELINIYGRALLPARVLAWLGAGTKREAGE